MSEPTKNERREEIDRLYAHACHDGLRKVADELWAAGDKVAASALHERAALLLRSERKEPSPSPAVPAGGE